MFDTFEAKKQWNQLARVWFQDHNSLINFYAASEAQITINRNEFSPAMTSLPIGLQFFPTTFTTKVNTTVQNRVRDDAMKSWPIQFFALGLIVSDIGSL